MNNKEHYLNIMTSAHLKTLSPGGGKNKPPAVPWFMLISKKGRPVNHTKKIFTLVLMVGYTLGRQKLEKIKLDNKIASMYH